MDGFPLHCFIRKGLVFGTAFFAFGFFAFSFFRTFFAFLGFVVRRFQSRWCGDAGNGEVAIGDRAYSAVWQRDAGDMDRITNFQASHVDLDLVRDMIRIAHQVEFVTDNVHDAAAFQARRFFFVDEDNWNVDLNLGAF